MSPPSAPPAGEPGSELHPWLRRAISLALLLHVLAVVIPPLAVEPASQLAGMAWQAFSPYIQAAFLDHGYRFFAPEPGPSHLIRYELTLADGSRQTGAFPNLEEHWPRLFYHRHFMLTEFINSLGDFRPEVQKVYVESYARHLLKKHDATSITLHLKRHVFPDPTQVLEGMKLDDPSLYRERSLGTFAWAENGELTSDLSELVPPVR